jgi:hypothetical protein
VEILLTKAPQGHLIPASEDEGEKLRRIKSGAMVRADVVEMRNGKFFAKWWALAKIAFDAWAETVPEKEYRGFTVAPNFQVFRKQLTVMAGFCYPVFDIKGEMRLEPESLKWGSMTEERFTELYDATINAVLQKVLPRGRFTEERLRDLVEQVVRFG